MQEAEPLKVVSIKTTDNKAGPVTVRIGLSDGALFSFNPYYLPHPYQGGDYFYPEREINAEEAAALRFAADCYRAERAGLRLVARAEQTRMGMARKLEQRGHGAAPAKAAVAYLAEMEIVDDRRFAERWIQARLYRGADSPIRLVQGLCQRGIGQGIAREACKSALDFDRETALLGKYIAKKYPALGRGDASDRQKPEDRLIRGQLKREGFSAKALEWYWEEG
jgi:regulatory protein